MVTDKELGHMGDNNSHLKLSVESKSYDASDKDVPNSETWLLPDDHPRSDRRSQSQLLFLSSLLRL